MDGQALVLLLGMIRNMSNNSASSAADAAASAAAAAEIANNIELGPITSTVKLSGIHWTVGSYIQKTNNANNGTPLTTSASTNYKISEFIPCHGKISCTVGNLANAVTGAYFIAFYDQNEKFISGLYKTGTAGEELTVDIPKTAYYLRLTAKKAQDGYITLNEIAYKNIADEVYDLKKDILGMDGDLPFGFKGGQSYSDWFESYLDGLPGEYTKYQYPQAFSGTYRPVNIYTDGKKFITDFNKENFKNSGGTVIYASSSGKTANPGTKHYPTTLLAALTAAQDGDTVIVAGGVYSDALTGDIITGSTNAQAPLFGKSINLIGEGDVRLLSGGSEFAGAYDDELGLWKRQYSGVTQMVDGSLRFRWPQAETLEACQATPGTWYTSGSYVYANSVSRPNAYLMKATNGVTFTSLAETKIYVENISFIGGDYNITVVKPADYGYEAVFNKCNFLFSYGGSNDRDSVWIRTGHVMFVQCRSAYASKDGFDYTPGVNGLDCQFVEIECIGDNNGLYDNTANNVNGSTAHEKATGIRVNGLYFNNHGANVADVQNNAMTINLGCFALNSKTAYQDMNQGFSAQQSGVTMWLDGCYANGNVSDIVAVNGSTMYIKDTVYSHRKFASGSTVTVTGGNHIPANANLDDYRTPGHYLYISDDTSGIVNAPEGLSERFFLQVVDNGYHPVQIICTNGKIFTRRSGTSGASLVWRSWYKYEGTSVGVSNSGNG